MQDVLIIGLEHGPSDGAMRRAQYVGRWSARPRLRGVQCRHERVPESFRAQQKYLKTSAPQHTSYRSFGTRTGHQLRNASAY
jgi:IS5 family transposase